jgi:hypothetical protein
MIKPQIPATKVNGKPCSNVPVFEDVMRPAPIIRIAIIIKHVPAA